jgi:hypothetical protein
MIMNHENTKIWKEAAVALNDENYENPVTPVERPGLKICLPHTSVFFCF